MSNKDKTTKVTFIHVSLRMRNGAWSTKTKERTLSKHEEHRWLGTFNSRTDEWSTEGCNILLSTLLSRKSRMRCQTKWMPPSEMERWWTSVVALALLVFVGAFLWL